MGVDVLFRVKSLAGYMAPESTDAGAGLQVPFKLQPAELRPIYDFKMQNEHIIS